MTRLTFGQSTGGGCEHADFTVVPRNTCATCLPPLAPSEGPSLRRADGARASCRRFNFFYGSLQMRIFVTRKNRHGVEAPSTTIGRSWQPNEKGPHKSSSYGMKGMLPSESIRKTLQLSVKCKELLRPPLPTKTRS